MTGFVTMSFLLAIIFLGLSVLLSACYFIINARHAGKGSPGTSGAQKPVLYLLLIAAIAGWAFITEVILARIIVTGHGPFSSMYEFSIAFSWGIVAAGLLLWWRYRILALGAFGFVLALALLLFAGTMPSQPSSLAPALQQSFLLSAHVTAAVIAYAAFAAGFGSAVFYLIRIHRTAGWLPEPDRLDKISYQAVVVGFFFITLVIVLGAFWADIAWGTYWSWDPKETASLVTWLIYAGYLHARLMRGWRGTKTAILIIVGFLAVLLTYFGNYFFGGLHSY